MKNHFSSRYSIKGIILRIKSSSLSNEIRHEFKNGIYTFIHRKISQFYGFQTQIAWYNYSIQLLHHVSFVVLDSIIVPLSLRLWFCWRYATLLNSSLTHPPPLNWKKRGQGRSEHIFLKIGKWLWNVIFKVKKNLGKNSCVGLLFHFSSVWRHDKEKCFTVL